MKLRLVQYLLVVVAFPIWGLGQSQPSQWGPWIPINDGYQSRVLISFKKASMCNGPSCLYWWRFQNSYEGKVRIDCELLLTDDHGRQRKDSCAAGELSPGVIKTNGGWWTYSTAEPRVLFHKFATASGSMSLPAEGPPGQPRQLTAQESPGAGWTGGSYGGPNNPGPGMGDPRQSEMRAAQYAKQREEVVKNIGKLTAEIVQEAYRAAKTGVNVNPYTFALKKFLDSTPTVDEKTERRQLEEARAEYQRRLQAKQELEQDMRRANVLP